MTQERKQHVAMALLIEKTLAGAIDDIRPFLFAKQDIVKADDSPEMIQRKKFREFLHDNVFLKIRLEATEKALAQLPSDEIVREYGELAIGLCDDLFFETGTAGQLQHIIAGLRRRGISITEAESFVEDRLRDLLEKKITAIKKPLSYI